MDESVRAAMGKWPNVPAVTGWLSLDGNGRWRLRGEPISHSGLIEFINRNYAADESGRWFFQNGPQRVYVSLAYAPLVLHIDAAGQLRAHTGQLLSRIDAACVDEDGHLLLDTDAGCGLVDSDALAAASEWLVGDDGEPLSEDTFDALLAGAGDARAWLDWNGDRIPLERATRAELPDRFGFVPEPRADAPD